LNGPFIFAVIMAGAYSLKLVKNDKDKKDRGFDMIAQAMPAK
jgi:hypothetical protein